jgi:hypothetical protein
MQDGIIHSGKPQLDLSNVRNNNDTKPDLMVEWGIGGPDVDINEPAGEVQRNIPEDAQADAGSVIVFARDMMNRGYRLSKVASALKSKFGRDTLLKARSGLEEIFKGSGLIGRVAIDAKGYRSCSEALKAASNSPYKRFIRCVAHCECGEPHIMPYGGSSTFSEEVSTGNPTDDFLASERQEKSRMAAHCRSTMLPVVASIGDLDPSEMDSTLVEVMNVTGLPSGIKDEIMASKVSNISKLKAAFRYLDKMADESEKDKYAGKVSSSEHKLSNSLMEFDIIQPMEGDLDVVDEVGLINMDDMSAEPPEPMDVEMDQFLEPEFEGTGEVPVDDPFQTPDVLDMEMLSRPDDEMDFLAAKEK